LKTLNELLFKGKEIKGAFLANINTLLFTENCIASIYLIIKDIQNLSLLFELFLKQRKISHIIIFCVCVTVYGKNTKFMRVLSNLIKMFSSIHRSKVWGQYYFFVVERN